MIEALKFEDVAPRDRHGLVWRWDRGPVALTVHGGEKGEEDEDAGNGGERKRAHPGALPAECYIG